MLIIMCVSKNFELKLILIKMFSIGLKEVGDFRLFFITKIYLFLYFKPFNHIL
jgi:hypothetical protein